MKIIGLNPICSRLKDTVTVDKVKMAMVRGGMAIERDAKSIVRVDKGRLKNSISTVWKDVPQRQPPSECEPKDMIRHRGSELKVYVGTNVKYAAAQEYGLAQHGKPNYSYRPYIRPAFRKNQKTIMKEVKKAIEGKT